MSIDPHIKLTVLLQVLLFNVNAVFAQRIDIIPYPRLTVVQNGIMQLSCSFVGGSCIGNFAWKLNGSVFLAVVWINDVCYDGTAGTSANFNCTQTSTSCNYALSKGPVQNSEHGDQWQCGTGDYLSPTTEIHVIVPITGVQITTPNSNQVTVYENITREFVCETSTGRPQATIEWFKQLDGHGNVISIPGGTISTRNQGTLIITKSVLGFKPSRNDNNYDLYCTAFNNGRDHTKTSTTRAKVEVSYPCEAPTLENVTSGSEYRILDGKRQTLTCTAEDGRPLASLTWNCFNDGNNQVSISSTTVSRSVTWTARKSQEGRRCTCQPSYSIPEWNRQAYVQIKVLYPPSPPVFTVNRQTVSGVASVIENRTVDITCSSDSVPAATYTWRNQRTSTTNSVLTLSNVHIDNNGTQYSCTATNMMDSAQGTEEGSKSNQFSLNVLYPPRSPRLQFDVVRSQLIIPQQPLYVFKGDNFSILCDFTSSNPEPSLYQWTGQTGNNNVLTVTQIQTDRNLICTATNYMIPSGGSNEIGTGSVTVSAVALYGPSPPKMTFYLGSISSIKLQSELRVVNGTSFSVLCGGSDGKPVASYRWSSTVVSSSTERLTISNIDKRYSNTDLKCTAENFMVRTFGDATRGESHSFLKLIVLYGPSVYPLSNVTVVENQTFTNTCQSETGNPLETQYTWTLTDGSTHNHQTMSIQKVTRTNMGMYTCEAWNNMNPTGGSTTRGTDSSTFWLNVHYGSSISHFTINGQSDIQSAFNHTSTLSVSCLVDSNPGSTITIKRDNIVLSSVSDGVEATYTMTDVRCTDAGVYSCTAFNKYNGESRPTTQHIVVIRSPPLAVEIENNKTFYVAVHDSITLSLTVCAYPWPSSILWYKLYNNTGSTILKTEDKSSIYPHYNLTVEDIVMTDLGAYQIVLDNGLTPMLKYQFNIEEQGPPEVPSTVNLESATLTQDSLLIKWSRGFNGGLEQTFYIQYRPISDTTWITLIVTDTGEATMNITLTGLNPGTAYEVRVFAGNKRGNSSTSEPLQFTTNNEPTTSSAAGVVIGIIVGIVAALILIAVGALIIRQRTNGVLGVCGLKRKENDPTNQYQNVVYTNEKDRGKSAEESNKSNQYECLDQSHASLPRIYDDLDKNTSNERPQYESLRDVTDRTYDRVQKQQLK